MRVKYPESVEYKALNSLKGIRGSIVLRKDINDLDAYRQISRVLNKLIAENKLVKIGAGIYVKAYISENLTPSVNQGGFGQACKKVLTNK